VQEEEIYSGEVRPELEASRNRESGIKLAQLVTIESELRLRLQLDAVDVDTLSALDHVQTFYSVQTGLVSIDVRSIERAFVSIAWAICRGLVSGYKISSVNASQVHHYQRRPAFLPVFGPVSSFFLTIVA